MLTLLMGTFLGTVTNNVVNVPLAQITQGYHATLAEGVLVVSSFVVVLAAAMPLTGWVGDRFGRRRTLTLSLLLLAAGLLGSALAPNLPLLIGSRAVQGLACAAIAPAVMGALPALFVPEQRGRAMSSWAAANGLGQAVGPPLGGLVTGVMGWRSVFFVLAPITLITAAGAARLVPGDRGRTAPLHWPGAAALTLGTAMLMMSVTAASQHRVDWRLALGVALLGLASLAVFVRVSRTATTPLIPPHLLAETRFLRSSGAAFVQMAALATVLVAVPLYAVGPLGLSAPQTGLLVFALPAAMVAAASPVGRLADRQGPRKVMRVGLVVLGLSQVGLAVYTSSGTGNLAVLAGTLVLVGVGVASVQTPSAAGATRSPAGRSGAALGLFNMIRFAGSAVGAAWVATLVPQRDFLALFLGSGLLVAGGLALSFVGADPGSSPTSAGRDDPETQIRPA